MKPPDRRIAAEYHDGLEAQHARLALEAAGIDAVVAPDPFPGVYEGPEYHRMWYLLVQPGDEERSHRILTLGERSLPAEFRDESIAEWLAGLEAREARSARQSRTGVMVGLWALVAALIGGALIGAFGLPGF